MTTKFRFRMNPEWNPSQQVLIAGRTMSAAAGPYDVPTDFQVEVIGKGHVVVSCLYDFHGDERSEFVLQAGRVRMFQGRESHRLMRFEIDASDQKEATQALRDAAEMLRQFARTRETTQSIRQSVHLGMFEQALPKMGSFIEQRLKELRR